MLNKCTVCVVCVIGLAGLGLGVAGMVLLKTGSDDGWDAVDTVALNLTTHADTVKTTLDRVDALFTEVGVLLDSPSYYANLVDLSEVDAFKVSVDTFRNDVMDGRRDYYDPYGDWTVGLGALLLGIPALCMAAAALLAACSVRRFFQPCIVASVFCTGALLWLVAIFIQVMWVGSMDVCDEISKGAKSEPSIITGLLEENCNQDELDKAANVTTKATIDGARSICETLDTACNGVNSTLDCSAKPATATCVNSQVVGTLDTTVGWKSQFYAVRTQAGSCSTLDTPLYCPLRTCASECGTCSGIPPGGLLVGGNSYKECVGAQIQKYSQAIGKLSEITTTTERLMERDVRPFMQCSTFRDMMITPFDEPCQDMEKGLLLLWLGCIVVGITILIFIPVAVCGFKRFLPTSDHAQQEFFASNPARPVMQQAPPQEHYSMPMTPKEPVYHPTNSSVVSGIDYLDGAGPSLVTPVSTPTPYYQPEAGTYVYNA
eukprot:NODE_464_length_1905_cov_61.752531_g457_i0.p1 GENE.NODE_464_length_1905_cov_61.752531_g457_i0~~NODE_464_length_1905_cov_61.752531_g457_i0.p1  ORF type:complete len:488 (+),score=63.68 NODE_464_length_1905_cov_61.752531_g457_i0:361-1824(+)